MERPAVRTFAALKDPERVTLADGLKILSRYVSVDEAKKRLRDALVHRAILHAPMYSFSYDGAEIDWETGYIKIPRKRERFCPTFLRADFNEYFFENGQAPANRPQVEDDSTVGAMKGKARSMEWDVFVSHASEDKEEFARPLAEALRSRGLKVWFDEFTLTVGDSLRRSIDRGLANSRFGIVVISPNFLAKEWPQKELDGLVAREIEGVKVILPVWHRITAEEIRADSRSLADRLAASSDEGLERVVDKLLAAIGRDDRTPRRKRNPPAQRRREPARGAAPEHDQKVLQSLAKLAREFHQDRVAKIASGGGEVALIGRGTLVMHVVPFSALDERQSSAFDAISRNPDKFPPILNHRAINSQVNFDGLFTSSNVEGMPKPQRAYVQVFRSGSVEAAVSSLARGPERDWIILSVIRDVIIRYAPFYAAALGTFGIKPPMAVLVSLIDVKGKTLLQDAIGNAFPEDLPSVVLDRDQFHFTEAIFETVPASYDESANLLRPILNHLANTAGLPSPS